MVAFIRSILLLISLLSSICLYGQTTEKPRQAPVNLTFYYNINWELTTPEKSFFKREAYFDLEEMIFDGIYKDHNREGKLIAEGFYTHGVKRGIQTEYFDDHSTKLTVEYADNDFIIWQKVKQNKEYEITRGTGKFTINYFYFFDWTVKQGTLTGEFRNGKRVGTWVYHDLKKVKTDVEYYQSGKLLERVYYTKTDSVALNERKEIFLSLNSFNTETLSFDKETFASVNDFFEKQITYPASFQRGVAYPGGWKHLLSLLAYETQVPERNLALVKLKVNEHGQVLKSDMARSVNQNIDKAVLKAIESHGARFLPAIKDGKPYPSTIYIPISGGEDWMKTLVEMPVSWLTDFHNFIN